MANCTRFGAPAVLAIAALAAPPGSAFAQRAESTPAIVWSLGIAVGQIRDGHGLTGAMVEPFTSVGATVMGVRAGVRASLFRGFLVGPGNCRRETATGTFYGSCDAGGAALGAEVNVPIGPEDARFRPYLGAGGGVMRYRRTTGGAWVAQAGLGVGRFHAEIAYRGCGCARMRSIGLALGVGSRK